VLADKGAVVEEWIDLTFFRPVGVRLARRLMPTRVTPDQVTLGCLLIGLLAGHLFLYDSVALNLLGLALFIVSDVFDSADGQLARMRGTSTRVGRMLDGVSDNFRFLNLYAHLGVRLMLAGWTGAEAFGLATLAGVSHSMQSTAADFIRQAWLYFVARKGEFDLPETVEPTPAGAGIGERIMRHIYRGYVRRQARLFPCTSALVRARRSAAGEAGEAPDTAAYAEYAQAQERSVRRCAWIAQNIRFALLAVTAVPGWPEGFFWLTLVPLNLVLVLIIAAHERHSAALGPKGAEAEHAVPAGAHAA
jgi:hypothetical protein